MILYFIYFIISPFLWMILQLISIFNKKILQRKQFSQILFINMLNKIYLDETFEGCKSIISELKKKHKGYKTQDIDKKLLEEEKKEEAVEAKGEEKEKETKPDGVNTKEGFLKSEPDEEELLRIHEEREKQKKLEAEKSESKDSDEKVSTDSSEEKK